MAENPKLLMLRLEGVLQSWGESSKWDYRDSALMPTKSGIVGLIACAMGLERGNPEIDAIFDAITLAVRADRPGVRMTDYHTAAGDPLMNAEGKPRSNGFTVVSRRQYLQDASFLAVIQSAPVRLESIGRALQNPKWCLFLGRKSCVPSRPVFDGIHEEYAGLRDAVQRYPTAKGACFPLQYEWEAEAGEVGSYTRTDALFSGAQRQFVRRQVWRGIVKGAENVPDKN